MHIYSRLAEERRRRVQELERQIVEDKKKLTEISRLQQKYKSEQEANKRLEEEIVNLKKVRREKILKMFLWKEFWWKGRLQKASRGDFFKFKTENFF